MILKCPFPPLPKSYLHVAERDAQMTSCIFSFGPFFVKDQS